MTGPFDRFTYLSPFTTYDIFDFSSHFVTKGGKYRLRFSSKKISFIFHSSNEQLFKSIFFIGDSTNAPLFAVAPFQITGIEK